MSKGFEDCIDLSKEINDNLEQFAGSHWIFTQDEWENKVKSIKNSAIEEFISEIDLAKPMHFTKEQSAWIKKYVIQKRHDAIEEFRNKINKYLTESNEFADFVATDTAIDYVLEEMKGGAK